ncbi:competence protein A [Pasteurella multocida subsp. multocida str. Anand1_cattle]|nr:competence protein A [Pasteurella multocida subsp. multocida str. Anand1_cattle]
MNSTYTQFCQRYPTEIESVVVYQTERISALLPTDWTMLQTEVPLIALGNALWHGKSD